MSVGMKGERRVTENQEKAKQKLTQHATQQQNRKVNIKQKCEIENTQTKHAGLTP